MCKAPVQRDSRHWKHWLRMRSQFYSEEKDSDGNYIGVAVALQKAYDKMGNDAVIASMPYLIMEEANADKKKLSLAELVPALSEENAGIDKKESLLEQGKKL